MNLKYFSWILSQFLLVDISEHHGELLLVPARERRPQRVPPLELLHHAVGDLGPARHDVRLQYLVEGARVLELAQEVIVASLLAARVLKTETKECPNVQ